MRSSIKLALLASAPLVLISATAFAQDTTAAPTPAPAPSTPPADSSAAAPSDASPTPAPAPVASTDGTVLVHMDSSSTVTLERRSSPGVAWEHACESPCDQRLPGGDEYRVVGTNLNESAPFYLDGSKGDAVNLVVAPGDKGRARTGMYVLIGGGVLLVTGLVVGLVAGSPGDTFSPDGSTHNGNYTAVIGAMGLGLVGISAGIFGGAWMLNNAHSRVGGDVQGPAPARGDNAPMYLTGMRTPAPTAPALSFPIFRTSF